MWGALMVVVRSHNGTGKVVVSRDVGKGIRIRIRIRVRIMIMLRIRMFCRSIGE